MTDMLSTKVANYMRTSCSNLLISNPYNLMTRQVAFLTQKEALFTTVKDIHKSQRAQNTVKLLHIIIQKTIKRINHP